MKKKAKPLISIIMNCYNGEKFLNKSLKSVQAQTYNNWELIFWDNNSKDKSKQILYKFSDRRIRYFKSKQYLKLYEARNCALKKAKGKYISFLDTDDWWDRNKLTKQIKMFKKKKKVKLVYSNFYLYHQKIKSKKIFSKKKLPEGKITQNLLNKYQLGILTVLVKKEVFNKRYFNKKYEILGDFDFFIRLSLNNSFVPINKPLAYYRIHGENASIIKIKLYINELKKWISINESLFNKKNFSLNGQKIHLNKLKIKKLFFGFKTFFQQFLGV